MFSSRFESLSKLPKPFGLFDKTQNKIVDEGDSDTENNAETETKKGIPIREGLANAPPPKDPKLTDDIPAAKTFLNGILAAVFFILFVVVGMIYYFNSSILLTKDLMAEPFYTKTDYWQRFKGKMVASKIFIFGILWMIVFCLNLLLMDTVFKNHEYDNIFYVTTIYYWSIVGSTFMLIGNIPSLVDVFENTIGYSVLTSPLFNLGRVMSMFKNRNFQSDQFKMSYDFLITTFNVPSFHDYFEKLWEQYPTGENAPKPFEKPASDFYIDLRTWLVPEEQIKNIPENVRKTNTPLGEDKALYARRELLKCVLTKNTVGHYIWVLLSSYITILLTMNTVIQ